jgi:hypothetical protein
MPSLIHDRAFRRPGNGRARWVPGPELTSELGRVQSRPLCQFFTTRATSIPHNRPGWICLWRLIDRNSGPALMLACSIHA